MALGRRSKIIEIIIYIRTGEGKVYCSLCMLGKEICWVKRKRINPESQKFILSGGEMNKVGGEERVG